MELGVFGGSTKAGAVHNEDGALVLASPGSGCSFAAVLDGHAGTDSTEAVIRLLDSERETVAELLELPVRDAFKRVQAHLITKLTADKFVRACQQMTGETAVLFCAQKGDFLWWMSIRDNLLYVLHPEFARLGQYAINSRQFFQWVGRANSLVLDAPALTSGALELRGGLNRILLVMDGLLEFDDRDLESGANMMNAVEASVRDTGGVRQLLERVKSADGVDSATAIYWEADIQRTPLYPSG